MHIMHIKAYVPICTCASFNFIIEGNPRINDELNCTCGTLCYQTVVGTSCKVAIFRTCTTDFSGLSMFGLKA